MIQKLKISGILLISCFCPEYVQSNQNQDIIQVEIIPGVESNLIQWNFTEPTEIDSLILFRTESLRDSFQLLNIIPAIPNRYLDEGVSSNHRYFYKFIYHEMNGQQKSSNLDTPPFGRPLKMNKYQDIFVGESTKKNINNIEALITILIEKQISESKIFPAGFNIKALSLLLSSNFRGEYPWLDHLPVHDIFTMRTKLENELWQNISKQVKQKIEKLRPYYRNKFLMIPQEWMKRVEKGMYLIEKQINYLFSSFEYELELLNKQEPVRVSWIRSEENHNWVDILLLNPDQLFGKDIALISDQNLITILYPEDAIPGSVVSISIPNNWYECSLAIDGIHIQNFAIDHSQSGKTGISLQNGFILNSDLDNTFIIPETRKPVRLNELMYEPESKSLSIELLYESEVIDPLIVSVNNTNIWHYSPVYSNKQTIIDSQFNIPDYETNIIWMYLHINHESSNIKTMTESFPIITDSKTIWSRNPKDLTWEQASVSTMGLKNQLQKIDDGSGVIPELFALYQNYPNPFNLGTSIKFDLLKKSVVSLYVLNAAGLIESIYLDSEELTPGSYSYIWKGNHHSSGVYFVTLQAILEPYEPVVMSRKMIYLK
ncbi:MAG: hypothetical protein QF814_05575 [Candidatus Marinimicrobia bacterium]|nr:hypothetical protein [Candidatus Neomarinimicrobiota bacterium]HJM48010.1 hypothetical protein [Candidatus Neomarinimicrobiota bacterium]